MSYKLGCDCYDCKCEKKKDKCPKNGPCCQFKYVNNVLGKPGDIVEVIPSADYNLASVKKVDCDKEPKWLWANSAGGTMTDRGINIATDGEGNSYVTGLFEGVNACFGPFRLSSKGSSDIFVAKLNADGKWIWVQQAGGTLLDEGLGISIDCQGNVYVTGDFGGVAMFGDIILTSSGSSDIFVAKLDTNGQWLWVQQAGGSGADQGRGISVDCDCHSYVTGFFSGTVTFGNTTISLESEGNSDIFVAKLDSNGQWLWAQKAGNSIDDSRILDVGFDISVGCQDDVYVTGHFEDTATFGDIAITSKGDKDIFIAKIDTFGNWQWAQSAGSGVGPDTGYGIAVDCDGNVYVTGEFYGINSCFGQFTLSSKGELDIFVAKLDADGDWLWARSAGGISLDIGFGINVDCEGNPYITGLFTGTDVCFGQFTLSSKDFQDIFAAKLDVDGNWLWVKQASGPELVTAGQKISIDCQGNAYVTGFFGGTNVCFDSIILSSKGPVDIFVAKISSTNLGTLGFLGDYAQPNQLASVCFPGGVILEDTFNQDLKPGNKYYIDCKCQLSTCCKCAKQFVGVACDKDKMITGIHDNCCTKH